MVEYNWNNNIVVSIYRWNISDLEVVFRAKDVNFIFRIEILDVRVKVNWLVFKLGLGLVKVVIRFGLGLVCVLMI